MHPLVHSSVGSDARLSLASLSRIIVNECSALLVHVVTNLMPYLEDGVLYPVWN